MSVCKIIAVANQEGGVAKSTTSYNFAACLSESGKRVLLVDLDPHASLTILYGIDQPDELEFTVCDLMKARAEDKGDGSRSLHPPWTHRRPDPQQH